MVFDSITDSVLPRPASQWDDVPDEKNCERRKPLGENTLLGWKERGGEEELRTGECRRWEEDGSEDIERWGVEGKCGVR